MSLFRTLHSWQGTAPRLRLASALAALLPPFVANRLRTWLLRGLGIRLGRTSIIWGTPTFLGDTQAHTRLWIGEESGFNVGCLFDLAERITIGNHVGVGHDVLFLTQDLSKTAPIVVGDGAWIGARCTILPGVTIGAGAVIGANMVIESDVPPHTLLMGKQKISLAKWR
ncbi:MAG: acyltransferase [Armatimonadetes bacterium]|nr:acyltransferase [Armatimonadota bacterium]